MKLEDVKALISFSSPGGTTYYYDQLTSISDSHLMYNGRAIEIGSVDPEFIQSVKDGKATYEAYKLANAESSAEKFIQEQTQAIIADRFEPLFQGLEQCLLSYTHNAVRDTCKLVSATDTLLEETSEAIKTASSITARISSSSDRITSFVEDTDFSSLKRKMDTGVADLAPLKQQLAELTALLKELSEE